MRRGGCQALVLETTTFFSCMFPLECRERGGGGYRGPGAAAVQHVLCLIQDRYFLTSSKHLCFVARTKNICLLIYSKTTCLLYLYQDKRRDIWSNIHLCLKEFPRAKPEATPEDKGVYLTVYPESSPKTDSISFNSNKAHNSLISLIDNYSVYPLCLGSVL